MHPVAGTLLVIALGLAATPAVPAHNECQGPCQTVIVPATLLDADGRVYFVYAQAATCVPPASGTCAGQPAPLVAGLVYEDTNCEGGLQRYPTVECGADSDILL